MDEEEDIHSLSVSLVIFGRYRLYSILHNYAESSTHISCGTRLKRSEPASALNLYSEAKKTC
jgi:hypothetical protein